MVLDFTRSQQYYQTEEWYPEGHRNDALFYRKVSPTIKFQPLRPGHRTRLTRYSLVNTRHDKSRRTYFRCANLLSHCKQLEPRLPCTAAAVRSASASNRVGYEGIVLTI